MRFEPLSWGCLWSSESLGLVLGRFFHFLFVLRNPLLRIRARARVKRRYLRRRTVAFSSLFNFALPTPFSAQSRGATKVPCSRVTWYRAMYGPVCHLLFFCVLYLFYFVFSAKHFPLSRDCRCGHLPSRVFVVSSSNPPPCRWPAGGLSHDFSLVLAPVFPSISTRARLAIVPVQWLVCRRVFPAPPRHTGGMRQVEEPFLPPPLPHRRYAAGFDGWLLPCCRVCVSFNCFSPRAPGSIARP